MLGISGTPQNPAYPGFSPCPRAESTPELLPVGPQDRSTLRRKQRQITSRKLDRTSIWKIARRRHVKTYDVTQDTQNGETLTVTNTTTAGSWKNSTTADGSSFNGNVCFGKDNQRVCFNDAAKVKHRFGRTANGHLIVIMKVRPAREVNEAVHNERLSHMGLTLLCTLDPGNWDIDERLIATRSLDTADKTAHRGDWAQVKQLRRIQVRKDMQTTERRKKARHKKDMTLVNVLDWEGAFGPDTPVGERSVIIVLPRAEKNYEIEKTYETARVAVFANYRGEAPMHELVPHMAGLMWIFWNESKVKPPEEHADDIANHGAFNEWVGADMEAKEEDDDAL